MKTEERSGKKKNSIGRNMGRIEYMCCLSKTRSMLKRGYDLKKIHAALKEQKMITMSYQTFCNQHASYNSKKNAQERNKSVQQRNSSVQGQRYPRSGQGEGL